MRGLRTRRGNGGFTYLALLLVIVVMGAVLGGTAEVWHTAAQREKERELLFAGNQFRMAIGAYYQDHAKYPHELADLLKDSQYAATRRYLRKLFRDPITGGKEWGVVRRGDGGIVGVHSLSEKTPLKIAGFGTTGGSFDGAVKYSQWIFAYLPRGVATTKKLNLESTGDKPLWQQ
jgi:type II secretory pathway pseudopilin PulG